MTDKINDGGPAYPHTLVSADTSGWLARGLTKREVFAMAAMQGLIAACDFNLAPDEIAHDAVIHADALLAELAKGAGR